MLTGEEKRDEQSHDLVVSVDGAVLVFHVHKNLGTTGRDVATGRGATGGRDRMMWSTLARLEGRSMLISRRSRGKFQAGGKKNRARGLQIGLQLFTRIAEYSCIDAEKAAAIFGNQEQHGFKNNN